MTGVLMKKVLAAAFAAVALLGASASNADTLEDIQKRGQLRCGLSDRAPGFSLVNAQGKREGFEVDYCDALAAAIFGSVKVEYVPLQPRDAFTTLKSGGVDIFADRAAWTYLRDSSLGFSYPTIYFYEGQGFMVPRRNNVASAKQLGGATFCSTQGTTYELNLADWMGAQGLQYRVVNFADFEETRRAYEEGRCDVWTADVGNLAARGISLARRADHVILPEVISREPLGPMVREGDERWRKIAMWVHNARIAAEDFGITAANVDKVKAESKNPEVQRMLGVNGEFGSKLGLANDWAVAVIKAAGNYADTWEKHLGPKTPLALPRGQSALVKDGGLLYPLPFR
jgi:general L-amino acid transport system substrate-binding protein